MRKKIFSEEKCYIGIILLGTKKKNNSLNLNSITVLRDLSLLGADHILKVDEVIKGNQL